MLRCRAILERGEQYWKQGHVLRWDIRYLNDESGDEWEIEEEVKGKKQPYELTIVVYFAQIGRWGISAQCSCPMEYDSKHAARIISLVPDYEKPLMGTLAALEIGLDAIRRECPLFRNWIERLEQWPQ